MLAAPISVGNTFYSIVNTFEVTLNNMSSSGNWRTPTNLSGKVHQEYLQDRPGSVEKVFQVIFEETFLPKGFGPSPDYYDYDDKLTDDSVTKTESGTLQSCEVLDAEGKVKEIEKSVYFDDEGLNEKGDYVLDPEVPQRHKFISRELVAEKARIDNTEVSKGYKALNSSRIGQNDLVEICRPVPSKSNIFLRLNASFYLDILENSFESQLFKLSEDEKEALNLFAVKFFRPDALYRWDSDSEKAVQSLAYQIVEQMTELAIKYNVMFSDQSSAVVPEDIQTHEDMKDSEARSLAASRYERFEDYSSELMPLIEKTLLIDTLHDITRSSKSDNKKLQELKRYLGVKADSEPDQLEDFVELLQENFDNENAFS